MSCMFRMFPRFSTPEANEGALGRSCRTGCHAEEAIQQRKSAVCVVTHLKTSRTLVLFQSKQHFAPNSKTKTASQFIWCLLMFYMSWICPARTALSPSWTAGLKGRQLSEDFPPHWGEDQTSSLCGWLVPSSGGKFITYFFTPSLNQIVLFFSNLSVVQTWGSA